MVWLDILNWMGIVVTDSQKGIAHFCHHELRFDSKHDGKFKSLIGWQSHGALDSYESCFV